MSVFSFFPLFTSSPFCPTKKQSERKTFRLFSLSARHVVHPVLDAPGESSSGEPQLSSVLCRREGRGRGMRQVENGGGRERNRERSAAIVENSTSTSSRQEEKKNLLTTLTFRPFPPQQQPNTQHRSPSSRGPSSSAASASRSLWSCPRCATPSRRRRGSSRPRSRSCSGGKRREGQWQQQRRRNRFPFFLMLFSVFVFIPHTPVN